MHLVLEITLVVCQSKCYFESTSLAIINTLFADISLVFFRYLISSSISLQGIQLGKLLDEDPTITQRRTNIAKRLELYRTAQSEVDVIAWSK